MAAQRQQIECIEIDTSAIPAYKALALAEAAIALTEQVFSMPGAEERYQEWLRERKNKKAAAPADTGNDCKQNATSA